ncbi:Zn-dependent M28 family amino/carboxypeptidase [Roseivirga pacifica]|uniref:Carboxypeptidase Q n=1 Tax=Roseivirga pacifica TaxID=1267423 RepID=A0A1I0MNM1_9BACT|nr:M28 family peptidase [Roseivirga pacifica]RKQ50570.1 Zn-dependent M28 family amino/carboxypeptidase [Roseivirga pacifica]SEV90125.1 Zn-dependent amino-or carboxypeptidase, M28 family [Roseivirga pacifica]
MKKLLLFSALICTFFTLKAQSDKDTKMVRAIFDEALERGESYQMLHFLTKNIGPRLAGSPGAAAAVEWTRQQMMSYGFDTVFLQPVMVPHWVRGKQEKGRIVNSQKIGSMPIKVVALGNSIGTGPDGTVAEVVEVQDFDELEKLGRAAVEGKIVFFNRPMDPKLMDTFAAYSGAVNQRGAGPSEAAKYGAIGVVVRSMSSFKDDVPHTGSTNYALNVPKIPAVAISTNDADLLSGLLKDDDELKFYFETHAQMLPEVLSYNVVGEIRGTEKPDEIIVVGGHLDSWDLSEGAHDDGAGCMQSIEVLRLFKAMNYKPKRTLRAVMFMNEENGLRGGRKYAELAAENGEKHIAAMESDRGGFLPIGFGMTGTDKQLKKFMGWKSLFEPYNIFQFKNGGGGADISPLRVQDVPLIGYIPDSQRYFKYHHTGIDNFETVNQRELELGAAAMASVIYLIDQYGL